MNHNKNMMLDSENTKNIPNETFDLDKTDIPEEEYDEDKTDVPVDNGYDEDKTDVPVDNGYDEDKTDVPVDNGYDEDKTDVPVDNGYDEDKTDVPAELSEERVKAFTVSTPGSIYLIDGLEYVFNSEISTGNSGEADVIGVKRDHHIFALKLYKGSHTPNTDILSIVKSLKESKFLVPLLSFGYCIRKQDKAQFAYELMDYIANSTLSQFNINKDEEMFRKIALNAAVCIDLCHKKGILHKDIKPANFFITDIDKGSLILADFGVSTLLDKNGFSYTLQSGTTTYNAPEMYNADGNRVRLTPKSDFYSLGIMLMSIWMGESKFRAEMGDKSGKDRIFDLRRKKAKGDLPYPTDLSGNLLLLIKGLTVPDDDNRWGFEEIIKWSTGKLKLADMSVAIHDKPFVFNEALSKVAHSPEELASFMEGDRYYALKILKRGKVSEWLHSCNRDNMATNIDDIVDNERDDNACVMRCVYLLDHDYPYRGKEDEECRTLEELSSVIIKMAANDDEITNTASDFYCFLQSHGREDLCDICRKIINANSYNPQWEIAVTLNPQQPFVVYDSNKMPTFMNTTTEVANYFRDTNCIIDKNLEFTLTSDAFMKWIQVRDSEASKRISIQRVEGCSTSNHWCVIYNLDLNRSYEMTLSKEEGKCHKSYDDIKDLWNDIIIAYFTGKGHVKSKDIRKMMLLGDDGNIAINRFYYYIKSKGKDVEDIYAYVKGCFKEVGAKNSNRCVPYTEEVAIMKTLKGLMGEEKNPRYLLKASDKMITTPDELRKVAKDEIANEIEDGYLCAWLSLFYQDNPFADLSEAGQFEKLVNEYLSFIGKLYPDYEPVRRLNMAKKSIKDDLSYLKTRFNLFNISRMALMATFGLASLFIILAILQKGIIYDVAFIKTRIVTFATIGAVAGGLFGILQMLISGKRQNELAQVLIGAVGGTVVMMIIYGLMVYGHDEVKLSLASLLFIFSALVFWKCRKMVVYDKTKYKSLVTIENDVDAMFVQPTHFAFQYIYDDYEYEEKDTIVNGANSLKNKTQQVVKWFAPSIVIMLMFIGGFIYVTPAFGGRLLPTMNETKLDGVWEGTFEGNPAAINMKQADNDSITATVYVTFKHSVKEDFVGIMEKSDGILNLNDCHENGVLDGRFVGKVNKAGDTYEGTYTNSKTGKEFSFTFTKNNKNTDIEK